MSRHYLLIAPILAIIAIIYFVFKYSVAQIPESDERLVTIIGGLATTSTFFMLFIKDSQKQEQITKLGELVKKQDAKINELKRQAEATLGIFTIEQNRERDRIKPILSNSQRLHIGAVDRVQKEIRLENTGSGIATDITVELAKENPNIVLTHNQLHKINPNDAFTIYLDDNRPPDERYHKYEGKINAGQISFTISVFYKDEIGTQYRADINSNTLDIKTERV